MYQTQLAHHQPNMEIISPALAKLRNIVEKTFSNSTKKLRYQSLEITITLLQHCKTTKYTVKTLQALAKLKLKNQNIWNPKAFVFNRSMEEQIKAQELIHHNSSWRKDSRRTMVWDRVNLWVLQLRLGWIIKSRMLLTIVNLKREMSLINPPSFNLVITFSKIWGWECKSLR